MASMFCKPEDVLPLINAKASFTDTVRDANVLSQIKAATALIRTTTRRDWEKRSRIQFVNKIDINANALGGNGMVSYYLDEFPLDQTVPIIVKSSDSGQFGDVDPEDPSTYQVEYDAIGRAKLVWYTGEMSWMQRAIQIGYTAGFPPIMAGDPPEATDVLDVDDNLKAATAIQAAFMYKRQADSEAGQANKSNRRGSAVFTVRPTGLVQEAQSIIRPYIKLLMGR